jgi:site-specific recombinase XerD
MKFRLMITSKLDRKGETPITFEVQDTIKGKRAFWRFATGYKVAPKLWNVKKEEVSAKHPKADDINLKVQEQRYDLLKIITDTPDLTIPELKQILHTQKDKKENIKAAKVKDFFDYYEEYILHKEAINVKSSSHMYSLKGRVEEYLKEKKIKLFLIQHINEEFFTDFFKWLLVQKFSINTIRKKLEYIKIFLAYLKKKGLPVPDDFREWDLPSTKEKKIITLTKEELKTLYNFQPPTKKMEKVKDLLLFGCSTGLRYSDVIKVSPHNIVDGKVDFTAQKTSQLVAVPLNNISSEILRKHDNDLRKIKISNQKYNDYMKDLCKVAEINSKVTVNKYEGLKVNVMDHEKWEVVSSHIGRRTFITLALEADIPAEVVMKYTGHVTYKSFKKYVDITDKRKKEQMEKFNDYLQL